MHGRVAGCLSPSPAGIPAIVVRLLKLYGVVGRDCVVVGAGSCRRVPVSSVPETSTESVCPSPPLLPAQHTLWREALRVPTVRLPLQPDRRFGEAVRTLGRGVGERFIRVFGAAVGALCDDPHGFSLSCGRAVRTAVSLGRSPSHSKLCGTAVCCELVRVVAASQPRQLWTGVPLCQCVLGVIRAVVGGLSYLPSLHAKRTISALAFDPPVVSLLVSL